MNDETPSDYASELTQLGQFLPYRVSKLHAKLNTQATKILRESVGISQNQWRMIAFIGSARTITASELVTDSAMDKGLVSRKVKSLIEAGLVTSSTHEKDSRVHVLNLTPAGRGVYNTALPIMRRRQIHLQKTLRDVDIETFRRVIDALEVASEETDI